MTETAETGTARKPRWAVIGIAAGAAVAAAIGGAALTANPSAATDPRPDLTAMADACHAAVKDRLKAPATAQFSEETQPTLYDEAGGEYVMRGAVDAQNGFGALLRHRYSCEAGTRLDGTWWARITYLQVG